MRIKTIANEMGDNLDKSIKEIGSTIDSGIKEVGSKIDAGIKEVWNSIDSGIKSIQKVLGWWMIHLKFKTANMIT